MSRDEKRLLVDDVYTVRTIVGRKVYLKEVPCAYFDIENFYEVEAGPRFYDARGYRVRYRIR